MVPSGKREAGRGSGGVGEKEEQTTGYEINKLQGHCPTQGTEPIFYNCKCSITLEIVHHCVAYLKLHSTVPQLSQPTNQPTTTSCRPPTQLTNRESSRGEGRRGPVGERAGVTDKQDLPPPGPSELPPNLQVSAFSWLCPGGEPV